MFSYFLSDCLFFLPELYLLTSFFFIFFIAIVKSSNILKLDNINFYSILVNSTIFLVIYIFLVTFFLFINYIDFFWYSNIIIFNYSLELNLFILYFKIFILLLFIIFLSSCQTYFKFEKIFRYEFIYILFLSVLGIFFLISSFNLIVFFLSLEFLSLSLYVLVAMKTNSKYSTEAALKYYIISTFSSGLILYSLSFLYGTLGLINFDDIQFCLYYFSDFSIFCKTNVLLCCIFLLIGFFFKLIIVPFHSWAPDVYEGSPTIITLFLSIFPKSAFFFLFLKLFLKVFFELYYFWYNFLILGSLFSIIIGTFAAFYQIKLKRLLIFSAIVNNSYFLLSISTGSFLGLQSFIIYFIFYLILIFGIFLIILSLRDNSNSIIIKKIYSLKYYSLNNLYCSIILSSFLFSLGGIPPLIGFFGKFFIFFSLIDLSLFFISFFFILLSVFSTFYYLRLINLMFFSLFNNFFLINFWTFYKTMPKIYSFWLSIFFFFNFIFLIDPSFIFFISYSFVIHFLVF